MAQFGLQRAHLSPHLERGLSDKAEESQLGTPHSPNPVLLILLLIVYLLPFDEALQVSHPYTHPPPYYPLLYTEYHF